jgi:hypothetical protein
MLRRFSNSPRVTNTVMGAVGVLLILAALGYGAFSVWRSDAAPHGLATPVGEDCGTLNTLDPGAVMLGDTVTYSAVPAECLWEAFQQCSTATLTFKDYGLDAGYTHVIIVRHAASGCSVSDSVLHFIDERSDYASYTCAGILPPTDGVFTIAGCGEEGDVIIKHLG